MELTPIAPRLYNHRDGNLISTIQTHIVAFLLQNGVRVAEQQLRGIGLQALTDLYDNLHLAASQGATRLASLFGEITGRYPNPHDIFGMFRYGSCS